MDNSHASPSQVIGSLAARLCESVGGKVYGHDESTRLLFGAFVIGGHVLMEGPPGIAKTLLAKTFARSMGLKFRRVQFTPDLMPSDITGVNVFDPKSATFRFAPGPLFTDIILADEINRTPPKTQAALLEAMEEHQITVDGTRHPLGEMFFVIATQNPIEHEGTFPLPEAQLDRFLLKLDLTYPERKLEEAMIQRLSSELPDYTTDTQEELDSGISLEELMHARQLVRQVELSPTMSDYIVRIIAATREHHAVMLGASPRAGLYLALSAKLYATLSGRDYVIPDDLQAIIHPTLAHRLILQPDTFDTNISAQSILEEVVNKTPVPSEIK